MKIALLFLFVVLILGFLILNPSIMGQKPTNITQSKNPSVGQIVSSVASNLSPTSEIMGQITLIFVAMIIVGIAFFMSMIGRFAFSYSEDSEPFEREQTPEEQKQLFKEAEEQAIGTETQPWNCKNCGGPNDHQFCAYCGRAKE